MEVVNLRKYMQRRTRYLRLLILLMSLAMGFIFINGRFLLAHLETFLFGYLNQDAPPVLDRFEHVYHSRRLLNSSDSGGGIYPPDHFSMEELKDGAVVLHVIGMIYMFVALAIVCDEFFVPALGVITFNLKISDDVAGATFMAAGGSAPELFTSIIGVFLAKNNVGIGTIVGSATFNILFVIGMCAIVSKDVLQLTWWPLFRDMSFYTIDLLLLICFFIDHKVHWYEALSLFIFYFLYVTFMKFNHKIERFVKSKIKRKTSKIGSNDELIKGTRCSSARTKSFTNLRLGSGRFRQGVLQLMIHTIDPLDESNMPVHEKAMKLKAVATLSVMLDPDSMENGQAGGKQKSITSTNDSFINDLNSPSKDSNANCKNDDKNVQVHTISNGMFMSDDSPDRRTNSSKQTVSTVSTTVENYDNDGDETRRTTLSSDPSLANFRQDVTGKFIKDSEESKKVEKTVSEDSQSEKQTDDGDGEEEEEPLDLSWPTTWKKRIIYIIIFPIVILLWLTLPDVRRPEKRKWYMVTFFGSILWIGFFSYLMVWWANQTGLAMGISTEVMGLTILAAGTSIPDLITSVIVAKKGLGDMAVSSSVGSNIFDITVGLPFPWLLYSAIFSKEYIDVDSKGLFCSILLLFLMLLVVIVTVAFSKWRMTKPFAGIMIVLYAVFMVLSVLLELDVITCPVTT